MKDEEGDGGQKEDEEGGRMKGEKEDEEGDKVEARDKWCGCLQLLS